MKHIILTTLFISSLTFFTGKSIAQEQTINKQVRVTKAYQPIITDANKINVQPNYTDSTKIKAEYTYKINPTPLSTHFEVRPIKAARMVGVPLDKLYNTYVKAGIGNYLTPYAEISVNNLRSREYSVAGYAYHKSSLSKIKLDNDDKVNASYSHSKIRIDAAKFHNSFTWGGDVGVHSDVYHMYGYNTQLFSDSLPNVKGKDIKNRFNYIFADAFIKSAHNDSNRVNYLLNLHLASFGDNKDYNQGVVKLNGSVYRKINNSFILGINSNVHYIKPSVGDSLSTGTYNFNPYFSKAADDWMLRLGLIGTKDLSENGDFYVYPDILLQLNVIKNIIMPYAGASGGLVINDYQQVSQINPFINSGTTAMATNNKIAAFAGFKGGFNTKAFFNLQAKLEFFDNYLLFVNDSTTALQNNFIPVINGSNLNRTTYSAEMIYLVTSKLMVSGTFKYFKYDVLNALATTPAKAWHMPNYEANAYVKYAIQNKITFEANTFFVGKREAFSYSDKSAEELSSYADINLASEYKYNNFLSFYLQIQNLLNTKYQIWNQYPSQGLKVLLGFSYTL